MMIAEERATPIDLAAWLSGRWDARRIINDGAGRFQGIATFRRDRRGGLVWHERGQLRMGGYDGSAERTYLITPADGHWEIRFSDGRFFHALDLATGRCAAVHHCGEDIYRGTYEADLDMFSVDWRVTGPRKDDRIACAYLRI